MINMTKINVVDVVNYLGNNTWKKTAKHFKISEMTISRYVKKHAMANIINKDSLIKQLKHSFNKLIKKSLYDMSATELKTIYFFLTGKSLSMLKDQYIIKIKKIVGVVKWKKI